MKVNRTDHPKVNLKYDIDGKVHAVDRFDDAWCEDDDLEFDGPASTEAASDPNEWCAGCLASARDEGLVTE